MHAVVTTARLMLRDWSARELGLPDLCGLVRDGVPAYAWPPSDPGSTVRMSQESVS
ncbi:MAG TPA: hypothetical protein VJS67_14375 [Pseudonocardiaceae bacterium]|nr:hypothetical protein [Pseudonocardiaceae bacterium]